MPKPLRVMGLFLSVVIFGPVAFAAIVSFAPTPKEMGQPSDAVRLLRTFDDAFPQIHPMSSVDINFAGRECGYGTVDFLGDLSADRRNGWTPREGYFDLSAWLGDDFYQGVEVARANQLDQRLSSFELRFLNRCIGNSAFSKVCGFRVREVLEESDLYSKYSLPASLPRPNQSGRLKTICSFLDGVAARKGQKLGSSTIDRE